MATRSSINPKRHSRHRRQMSADGRVPVARSRSYGVTGSSSSRTRRSIENEEEATRAIRAASEKLASLTPEKAAVFGAGAFGYYLLL